MSSTHSYRYLFKGLYLIMLSWSTAGAFNIICREQTRLESPLFHIFLNSCPFRPLGQWLLCATLQALGYVKASYNYNCKLKIHPSSLIIWIYYSLKKNFFAGFWVAHQFWQSRERECYLGLSAILKGLTHLFLGEKHFLKVLLPLEATTDYWFLRIAVYQDT